MADPTVGELKRQFESYKIEMQRMIRQMGETIEELEARIEKLESAQRHKPR
jgi:hypothetical protein